MISFYSLITQINIEERFSFLLKQNFANYPIPKLLGILFITGFLMNLTPCVYPLIPVTISFFNRQASTKFFHQFKLSFSYFIGIALAYGIIGSLAALSGTAFGILFTKPWFSIGLGIFLIIFGLSMFDFYTLRFPQFINRFSITRNGVFGALTMGLIMGITATPCTGPLLAAAFLQLVNLNNPILCVISFMVIGAGLGFPYFILGCLSKSAISLPQSGAWLNWVKSVLGLCVLSIGLNYILTALPKEIQNHYINFTWTGFYVLSIFLLIRSSTKNSYFESLIYAVSFVFLGWLLKSNYQQDIPNISLKQQNHSSGTFVPFTSESYKKAKHSGRPTLIYVTADWCKICQQFQKNVLDQPSTKTLLKDLELLKIDWSTGTDEQYINYTQDLFAIPGIPFFVFLKSNGQISHTAIGIRSIQEFKSHLLKVKSHLGVN